MKHANARISTRTERRNRYLGLAIWFSVGTLLFGAPGYSQEPPPRASDPAHELLRKLPRQLSFCGEAVPLNLQDARERLEKEMLLTLWHRPQVILWLQRAARYFPIIERRLADERMPPDLKYIAVIESALRPQVRSSRGAVGFWQFLQSTGTKYGLRIDPFVDQRRNVYASTDAAIRYLKALYADFESWTLSAAAYNMGEEGLKAEILVQKVDDYYRLVLPAETERYIFRILAAKLIMTSPETYGFPSDRITGYPAFEFDRISLSVEHQTPIQILASAANTDFRRIRTLNPELRGYYLSPGNHDLLVPKGTGDTAVRRFETLAQTWSVMKNECVYVVRKGDNLSTIAARFGVPLPSVFKWNRLDPGRPIHPGDRIVIFPETENCRPETRK